MNRQPCSDKSLFTKIGSGLGLACRLQCADPSMQDTDFEMEICMQEAYCRVLLGTAVGEVEDGKRSCAVMRSQHTHLS